MNTRDNEKARHAYCAAHADAMASLEILAERLQNADAPDELTDWGNVGDMARLASQLLELVENP
jgi:hypothetical protein